MVADVHIASGIFYGLNTCTPLWCNKKYTWFLPTSCHFSNPQDSGWLLSNEVPCGELLVSLMAGAEHQEDQATISNLERSVPLPRPPGKRKGQRWSQGCAHLMMTLLEPLEMESMELLGWLMYPCWETPHSTGTDTVGLRTFSTLTLQTSSTSSTYHILADTPENVFLEF